MIDKKMLELIDRLAAKANSLEWKLDENTSGYFTELGGNYAEIRSDDKDDSHPYTFVVLDGDENEIERVNTLGSEISDSYRQAIEEMHQIAKRQSLGVDSVIEEMLKRLE